MLNVPIYRAKKIDSDEWVEGYFYIHSNKTPFIVKHTMGLLEVDSCIYEIDLSTLAIHFDGMIDKDGKKIFASLSEDGKGGDVTNKGVVLYTKFGIYVGNNHMLYEMKSLKVIGIQK